MKPITVLSLISLLHSSVAMSQETPNLTPAAELVADGSYVEVPSHGFTIAPPAGWNVKINESGSSASMVMEEPASAKPKLRPGDAPVTLYRRNITVATMQSPGPVDETRAKELKEKLVQTYSKMALITEFQALDHQMVELGSGNKALMVYSSMNMGTNPMMMMHMLVSGKEKQFLMTYTDLATRFQQQDAFFEAAWTAMTSIQTNGAAPGRYDSAILYGGGASAVLMLLAAFSVFAKIRRKQKLNALDDVSYDEDEDSSWSEDNDTEIESQVDETDEDELWAFQG